MVVAENRLSSDLIVQGLGKYAADFPATMLHYQDARGIPELRATLARLVQRTFMQVRRVGRCAGGFGQQDAVLVHHTSAHAGDWLFHQLSLHCLLCLLVCQRRPSRQLLVPPPHFSHSSAD